MINHLIKTACILFGTVLLLLLISFIGWAVGAILEVG